MKSYAPTLATWTSVLIKNPLTEPAASYQRVAVASLAPGAIVAAALLWKTGIRLNFELGIYLTLIALLAAGAILGLFGKNARLRNFATSFAALSFATLCAGTISHASLALQHPLIDGELLKIDQALGIDTPGLIIGLSHKIDFMKILGYCYFNSKLIIILTIIFLSITRKNEQIWEMSAIYCSCVIISAIIFSAFPAIGVFHYSGITKTVENNLPIGSGIYSVSTFINYYFNFKKEITLASLSGVVTFPSFHMVMALIIIYAWRKTKIINIIAAIYGFLVAVSCVPIGGHYVIDLIGGIFIWSAMLWAISTYARRNARAAHKFRDCPLS